MSPRRCSAGRKPLRRPSSLSSRPALKPAIARCQPLFDAMGQRTFIIGHKPSAANLVKISGNFLLATVIECLGRRSRSSRKGGVDPHAYLEILTSTLFSAPAYKTYGALIANEQYEPAGFKMTLGLKDLRLALPAAQALARRCPPRACFTIISSPGWRKGEGDFGTGRLWRGSVARKRRSLSARRRAQPAQNAAALGLVSRLNLGQAF